jgi:photosynthetic reaction center cytochrome c subunit
MSLGIGRAFALVGVVVGALLAVVLLLSFSRPPVTTVQRGYRGTAMLVNYTSGQVRDFLADNTIPTSLPPLPASGPKAGQVYKNVKVLGDLSVGQFTRLMASMTTWVAPKVGCAGCHNTANMAEDSLYTKVVARRMIQMVRHINADWTQHVQNVGVTCWTCHRGRFVPSQIWFQGAAQSSFLGAAESDTGKNMATPAINDSSLPFDPFTPYLMGDHDIRVQGQAALPDGNNHSIKEAEWTYALMIHFSQSLGVNCTYCHNTRAFSSWEQASPQRVTAWYGIRMVRNLNNDYLTPLHDVFPAGRLGPTGDSPKLNCATCHQGAYKPLLGVSMVQTFPELQGPGETASAAPTP